MLWGWTPETVLEHEHDASGRIVRTRVTTEAPWDEHQRLLLLEITRWRRGIGPHGYQLADTTSPLADPANPDGQWRYVADPLPIVDWAEKARLDAQDAYKSRLGENESLNGLIFTVERVEGSRPKLL